MLSEKAVQIITVLVQNDGYPIKAQKLSSLLDMSDRSFSTYIKEVKYFLQDNQIPFYNKQGKGIWIEANSRQKELIAGHTAKHKLQYSSGYRVWYIISLLINNWTSYTISLFADDLFVSKNTIARDLDSVEEWLAYYNIQLIRKTGSGICLSGSETSIRIAMAAVNRECTVLEYSEELAAKLTPSDYRLNKKTYWKLVQNYRSANLDDCIGIIQNIEETSNLRFSEEGFLMFLEYLLVMSKRSKGGYYFKEKIRTDLFPQDSLRADLAQGIIQQCLKAGIIQQAAAEQDYIYCLLQSADCQYLHSARQETGSPALKRLSSKILSYTSSLLGMNFMQNEALQNNLDNFLIPSLYRTLCGFELINPLISDVKKMYPAIFSVCYGAGQFYKPIVGKTPNEHEISYLALLLGSASTPEKNAVNAVVVCASGVGTAQLLAVRLAEQLPWMHIQAVLPYTNIQDIEQIKPQLILTTISSYEHKTIPTVFASPALPAPDIQNLRNMFHKINRVQQGQSETSLGALLKPELIFLNQSFQSKEKLLKFAAEKLEQGGYVTPDFYQSALNREQYGSTALGNGIAIPHSTAGAVLQPAVCLIQLSQRMDWSQEGVDLVFVLALEFVDIKNTGGFFKGFYNITSDESIINNLRAAKTKGKIYEIITESWDFE